MCLHNNYKLHGDGGFENEKNPHFYILSLK